MACAMTSLSMFGNMILVYCYVSHHRNSRHQSPAVTWHEILLVYDLKVACIARIAGMLLSWLASMARRAVNGGAVAT